MNSLLDINTTGTVVGFGDTIPGANQGDTYIIKEQKLFILISFKVQLFFNKLI
jgi:hypothetical protein